MKKTSYVQIRNAQIPCIIVEEKIYVAVNPIAEAIGLNAQSAVRNIKLDQILGLDVLTEYAKVGENQSRKYVFVPIQHIHGWLFTIDVTKVKEEVKPTLLEFKKECYNALFEHFYGKSKNIEKNLQQLHSLKKRSSEIDKEIELLKKEQKQIVKAIENLDKDNFSQLGLKLHFDNERPLLEKGGENGK